MRSLLPLPVIMMNSATSPSLICSAVRFRFTSSDTRRPEPYMSSSIANIRRPLSDLSFAASANSASMWPVCRVLGSCRANFGVSSVAAGLSARSFSV